MKRRKPRNNRSLVSLSETKKLVWLVLRPMLWVTDALIAVPISKAPTVEPEEELPEIDETTIDSYSQEVCTPELVGFLATH